MICYFISSSNLEPDSLNDLELFASTFPDFNLVELNNEKEFRLLLKLMNVKINAENNLDTSDFCKLWDISSSKLPELNQNEFNTFYNNWLQESGRINSMDEFGQLLFLQHNSGEWNKNKYRLGLQGNEH